MAFRHPDGWHVARRRLWDTRHRAQQNRKLGQGSDAERTPRRAAVEGWGARQSAKGGGEPHPGSRHQARQLRLQSRWQTRSCHHRQRPRARLGRQSGPAIRPGRIAPPNHPQEERIVLSSLASAEQHLPVPVPQTRAGTKRERNSCSSTRWSRGRNRKSRSSAGQANTPWNGSTPPTNRRTPRTVHH